MGCWGITAFESDAGLDAADFIRKNFIADGKIELDKIIEAMRQDEWMAPEVCRGRVHTGPMALAEIVMTFQRGNCGELDYSEEWAANDNKFAAVASFAAPKESVQWLRDYLSGVLAFHIKDGVHGGFFEEKDWVDYKQHMENLISGLDKLTTAPESLIELVRPREQANDIQLEQQM